MSTIFIFLIVLSVLVLVHELGHFVVAKRSGMRVDEFGFGFPPKLIGIKKGETEYTINLIPLGGFVRIHGESGEGRDDPESFASKSKWRRFLVLIAGVTMNVLFAWFLLTVGFSIGMPSALDGGSLKGATVSDTRVEALYVLPDSPADKAGIRLGDRFLVIDGVSVLDAEQARDLIVLASVGEEVELVIERKGVSQTIRVAPDVIEGDLVAIGTHLSNIGVIRYNPVVAVWHGGKAAFNMTVATLIGFKDLIGGLIVGNGAAGGVSGPVGIAVITGEVADLGFVYLLNFAAMLSVNLAILNVLPFPALDGGRILFLIIEALRRRPTSEKIEGTVHSLGFMLLMILIVLVTYKDIVGLIAR